MHAKQKSCIGNVSSLAALSGSFRAWWLVWNRQEGQHMKGSRLRFKKRSAYDKGQPERRRDSAGVTVLSSQGRAEQ